MMDDTTQNGDVSPAGSTGDVDQNGDVVGALLERLRGVKPEPQRDGGLWERWDPIAAEYGDTLEAVRLKRQRGAHR
jgi:hypothetical protein